MHDELAISTAECTNQKSYNSFWAQRRSARREHTRSAPTTSFLRSHNKRQQTRPMVKDRQQTPPHHHDMIFIPRNHEWCSQQLSHKRLSHLLLRRDEIGSVTLAPKEALTSNSNGGQTDMPDADRVHRLTLSRLCHRRRYNANHIPPKKQTVLPKTSKIIIA